LGLEGWLDPEHGATVRSLIEQLAARRPTEAGLPDSRTVPERHDDALIELCERARASDEFPTTAGERPHLTVTIDWDAPRTGSWYRHPGLRTADQRRRCPPRRLRCKLIPVVMGSDVSAQPAQAGHSLTQRCRHNCEPSHRPQTVRFH
jgi:hypothetical protein